MLEVNKIEFKYPTICLSVVDNTIVFTTKKIGSRFFEELSVDSKNSKIWNTINLKIFDNNNIGEFRPEFEFGKYYFEENYGSFVDTNYLFKKFAINSWSELFSDKVINNFRFVFITRNPISRVYTGFFEKVDSILGFLNQNTNTLFLHRIIDKYFDISNFSNLGSLPQSKIDSILNEFAQSVDYKIFNDEHLTLWNIFIYNFIVENKLEGKVQIIDLNDSQRMSIFTKLDQPTNKVWLESWINNKNNTEYVEQLFKNIQPYMDLEIDTYNKLLKMYYG